MRFVAQIFAIKAHYIGLPLFLTAIPSPCVATPLAASTPTIPHLKDLQRPATTVKDWLSQSPTLTQITNIRLQPVEGELEILVETVDGKPLQGEVKQERDRVIITIPNAQLQSEFRQDNPAKDILNLTATNVTATSVQIIVTAANGVPLEAPITPLPNNSAIPTPPLGS